MPAARTEPVADRIIASKDEGNLACQVPKSCLFYSDKYCFIPVQEKVDALNEKIERDSYISDKPGYDVPDFDSVAKTVGAAKQKSKYK